MIRRRSPALKVSRRNRVVMVRSCYFGAQSPRPARQASDILGARCQSDDRVRKLRADSLVELAERAGIDAGALAGTLDRYNADCERGQDSAFFKEPTQMRKVATAPFFAAEIRPAIVCFTAVGLRVDTEARVLDTFERPIPGFFAAGETTGGVMGGRYIGGGASIANAIVFGKIAGSNAAALGARSA